MQRVILSNPRVGKGFQDDNCTYDGCIYASIVDAMFWEQMNEKTDSKIWIDQGCVRGFITEDL